MTREDGANAIMGFAEVLLPGDGEFPSATASGMAGLLLSRLRGAGDGTLPDRLHAAITAAGGPLAPLSPSERHALVARIEANERKLFDEVRKIVYLTYYEQATVVAAIRALGTPYNWAPLPEGYAPEPFDAAIDAPKHARGHWTPTEQVERVDLNHLGRQSP
jgi:hypothetical protein